MIETDIIIIDSGVNLHNFVEDNIMLYTYENGSLNQLFESCDDYGHGTAIYHIIRKHSPSAKIVNIRLFDKNGIVSETELVSVLNYIKSNITCKIINLSLGIMICTDLLVLENVCKELRSNGTIIVSAFTNDGCYSFPAAFDTVIGVDSSYECKGAFEFEFVEGSPINVRAKGGFQKLKLMSGNTMILGGSSFACAYVTAFIANKLNEEKHYSYDALDEIQKHSKKIYNKIHHKPALERFSINKVSIFPFNKEMHSLYRYSKLLSFDINSIYDIRQSGRIGSNAKQQIDLSEVDVANDYIIKDIESLNYECIDAIIIGHLGEINRMLQKDIRINIIRKAIEKDVNVFSFDPLDYCIDEFYDKKAKVYYPSVCLSDVPQNTFGKLYPISKPVVAIFGTSSKQGKFSLQVLLKHMLEKLGYTVGCIGTEPHSVLFEMDFVYPMGYNSSISISEQQTIILLNQIVHNLCSNEIILTSSQANTIPYNFMNTSAIPLKQYSFLLGTQPDAVILCINPYDEYQYILNTIKYLEGTVNCKVIALVVFPMTIYNDWRGLYHTKTKILDEEFVQIATNLYAEFKIPVYCSGKINDVESLCENVINFFHN